MIKRARAMSVGVVLASLAWLMVPSATGAEVPPYLSSFSKPAAGDMQIIFHGTSGPFRIQSRASLDAAAPWVDLPNALVTELQPGVFLGLVPSPANPVNLAFYRIVSEGDPAFELKGWTILVRVSAPVNGQFFVAGESPVVTVTMLDTMAQGLNRSSFSTLNLYMYGPEDPEKAFTPVKLMNATADRSKRPHHYIDLKTDPNAQVTGTVITYALKPVSDEPAGTYTLGVRAVLAADEVQQLIKYATLQIGNATVEKTLVSRDKCAACHEGPVSGKMYMHHVDVGRSPVGSWSLDYEPVTSCKLCHNNEGYAAFTDASIPGVTNRVPDHIVIRVHGVHMGEHLKRDFNINPVSGNFRDYTHVLFPAEVKNCTACHVDDRWKTKPTRLACGACHDNVWFGPKPVPTDYVGHSAGPMTDDASCSFCHKADTDSIAPSIATSHKIPAPAMNAVDVALTPPLNGQFYVAGEKPQVTLVIRDDAGNPIDHTKVTADNFSTASLFVYGPRSQAVPVLTSAAKNVNSKLRASVSSSKAGPWDINGKVFKLAINGSAPQNVTIVGVSNLVTAAEVVASLNAVITNLNGGARASVSGANVNIRTTIQGSNARIEIYNGEVTTAMGWKRSPNTVLEPDVTVAAGSTPSNDLRALTDPLDYSDPMVTRNVANITYQLDDVAGLAPGTYNVYTYHLPRAGKIPGMTNATGLGHLTFQVGTKTAEPKVASNCADCHADTIFHLYAGPIHAAPFDADWCTACHDYGHTAPGDLFKNQGGTSLSGWSGYGAMPLSRRVHAVHFAHYLEHSEEIYANATKDTFGGIIFPQDVRNCTKCHSGSDSWKQKPSRVACLACHDSDAAKAHGKIMTFMTDANDPYGPGAVETCEVCHGAGKKLSPDKVHSIGRPYVPPYPRERAE